MRNINPYYKPLEQLVIQAQNEDYKALEELIKRVQKKVYTTLFYLSKKGENISDLTQEALLKMVKNLPNLRTPKAFSSWLNHIVLNVFYDDLRKKHKKPEIFSIETVPFFHQIPDKIGLPIEHAINIEADKKIQDEISNLPENFRVVIVLRELQGMSYEEIAKTINANVGTVKSRIARAREKLQISLKNYL